MTYLICFRLYQELQKVNGEVENGKIKSRPLVNDLLAMMSAQTSKNNLKSFKEYIESKDSSLLDNTNAIQYKYNLNLDIYNNNANSDSFVKVSPNQIMTNLGMGQMEQMQSMMYGSEMGSNEVWEEMLNNEELLKSQYDIVAGNWPKEFNEVVLIVDKDNKISDYTLYSLGLLDPDELTEKYKALMNGEKVEKIDDKIYIYDELLNLKFKLILNTDYYIKTGDIWKDMSEDEEFMRKLLDEAQEIKVVRNN